MPESPRTPTISSSNIPVSKPRSAAPRGYTTNAIYNSWLHYIDQPLKDAKGIFMTQAPLHPFSHCPQGLRPLYISELGSYSLFLVDWMRKYRRQAQYGSITG